MIRIIPGYNDVQMNAQVNIVRMRFMLQDQIAELEEESYRLTKAAWVALERDDVSDYNRLTAEAEQCQVNINAAMNKMQAFD